MTSWKAEFVSCRVRYGDFTVAWHAYTPLRDVCRGLKLRITVMILDSTPITGWLATIISPPDDSGCPSGLSHTISTSVSVPSPMVTVHSNENCFPAVAVPSAIMDTVGAMRSVEEGTVHIIVQAAGYIHAHT